MINKFLKTIGLAATSCIVSACSGIQHQMPEISPAEEFAALTEIEASSNSLPNHNLTEVAAKQKLLHVYQKIKPAAQEICNYADETYACTWIVRYANSHEYQAMAGPGNQIIVSHRVISAADNEDEIAFVLAHEISHHISDHIGDTYNHKSAGILIAGMAMAVLGHKYGGCYSSSCLNGLQNASISAMNLGANVAAQAFSKEQEKEADYLAAHIIHRAGYNLDLSRAALVKIGVMSDDRETSFMDSHPAGPQRLANYDKFVGVIKNDIDGLPGRRVDEENKAVLSGNYPGAESDSKNQGFDEKSIELRKCRFNLEAQNICIY